MILIEWIALLPKSEFADLLRTEFQHLEHCRLIGMINVIWFNSHNLFIFTGWFRANGKNSRYRRIEMARYVFIHSGEKWATLIFSIVLPFFRSKQYTRCCCEHQGRWRSRIQRACRLQSATWCYAKTRPSGIYISEMRYL